MELQSYLVEKFRSWQPSAPEVVARNKGDITLDWTQQEWGFLHDDLLYRVEKNNKLPKWIVVYSGGKTTKLIDYLAPSHPHRFRVKVLFKAVAVPKLAERALEHFGDEDAIRKNFDKCNEHIDDTMNLSDTQIGLDGGSNRVTITIGAATATQSGYNKSDEIESEYNGKVVINKAVDHSDTRPWLESACSAETWTSTAAEGASADCFCMAVRCGYLKQVQSMLEERPALLAVPSGRDGITPLAAAVRAGDMNMIRFLLVLGAELEQRSAAGQTALHAAVLAGRLPAADLLLERGADLQARDWNGLRAEHYAVDSGSLEMLRWILDVGDVSVKDNNGWTPLFRALCQGARTEIVEELVVRGSDLNAVDHAGLPLASAASLLKNRHGRSRGSVLRLVDRHYPLETGLANFTRLTKKIYNVHSLLKFRT